MKKNDSVYLSHILNSVERIEEYTEGMEKRILCPTYKQILQFKILYIFVFSNRYQQQL